MYTENRSIYNYAQPTAICKLYVLKIKKMYHVINNDNLIENVVLKQYFTRSHTKII